MFGHIPVLESLAVQKGQWISLVGPNGAGKSKLIKTLAALIEHEGSVDLLGQPWRDWNWQIRARRLSWLGQAEPGQEDLTVYDVAMLGRLPHQADWLERIRCLTEEGTSVISVLHELNLVLQADRLWLSEQFSCACACACAMRAESR